MPRLLLINPVTQEFGWERYFQLPPLALMLVAAAVPPGWEVVLADETLDSLPSGEGFDLIGITVMTHQAPRTYELAGAFRSRGIPVVLGGIHPTVLPEEATLHADAIVIGEAEGVMGELLVDAAEGKLKRVYKAPDPVGSILKIPRVCRELLDGRRYLTKQLLQTTRGCPYDCPFCTVTPSFGRRFRHRPTDEVLAEIETFPKKFMMFMDDDVLAEPSQATPLLEGLAGMGKIWAGQATLKFGEDPALLKLVARSGCIGAFVGVESVPKPGQSKLPKHRQVDDIMGTLKRIQDAGILVEGSFVFGFDHDDEGVFERTVRFVEDAALGNATLHLLTPYPGTALARQFEEEGRLLHKDWVQYNHCEVVFRPKGMSPERLYKGWVEARQALHSWRSIFSRVARNPHHRLRTFAYNVLRKGPDDRLETESHEA